MDEAIDMERQAHQADLERKAHLEEKRRQRGYTADGQMSEKERETRMLAFLYVVSFICFCYHRDPYNRLQEPQTDRL